LDEKKLKSKFNQVRLKNIFWFYTIVWFHQFAITSGLQERIWCFTWIEKPKWFWLEQSNMGGHSPWASLE
jgi:hypothetical protein